MKHFTVICLVLFLGILTTFILAWWIPPDMVRVPDNSADGNTEVTPLETTPLSDPLVSTVTISTEIAYRDTYCSICGKLTYSWENPCKRCTELEATLDYFVKKYGITPDLEDVKRFMKED